MPVFYDILVSVRRTLSNQIKVDLAKLFSIFLVNIIGCAMYSSSYGSSSLNFEVFP